MWFSEVFDQFFVDEIVPITDEDAFAMTQTLLAVWDACGISSGAVMHRRFQYAQKLKKDDVMVVILADFRTKLFEQSLWLDLLNINLWANDFILFDGMACHDEQMPKGSNPLMAVFCRKIMRSTSRVGADGVADC